MQQAPVAIRKSLFLLLNGAVLFLCVVVVFLYRDKLTMQQQNRQLIIQNDSIMSVNIVLTDSVRQTAVPAALQKSSLTKVEKAH